MVDVSVLGSSHHTEAERPLLGSTHRALGKRKVLKATCLLIAASLAVILLYKSRRKVSELVQSWVVPDSDGMVKPNPKMRYMYVKSTALRFDKKSRHQVLVVNDAKLHNRVAKQVQNRIQGLGFTFKPKKSKRAFNRGLYTGNEMRTCALYNLVIQANLVFDGWNECGYLLSSGKNGEADHGNLDETTGHAVISAPPNVTDCTPDKMSTEPCKTLWTRTLARNHESLLEGCLKKVRGISQTCRSFDRCGPHYNIPAAEDSDDKQYEWRGICHTSKVGFFKEPEIQRMCGICDMYRSTVSLDFMSPDAGFKKDPTPDPSAASTAGPGRAALVSLACAAVGLLWVRRATTA